MLLTYVMASLPIEFDWTLSLNSIVTVGGFCLAGIGFVYALRGDFRLLSQEVQFLTARVTKVEDAMRELVHANMTIAEQKGQIQTLEDRIDSVSSRLDNLITNELLRKLPRDLK